MKAGSRAEAAIRAHVHAGDRLPTPTGRGTFEVARVDDDNLVLLFGPKRAVTVLPWPALEGALEYLAGGGWVEIGARHSLESEQGSLEAYIKPLINRSAANYLAVVLERAGLVDLDRSPPARVRLTSVV